MFHFYIRIDSKFKIHTDIEYAEYVLSKFALNRPNIHKPTLK